MTPTKVRTDDAQSLIQPILDSFDQACVPARLRAPGGVLFPHDLHGIIKRTARLHGCTPEDLTRWIKARDQKGDAA